MMNDDDAVFVGGSTNIICPLAMLAMPLNDGGSASAPKPLLPSEVAKRSPTSNGEMLATLLIEVLLVLHRLLLLPMHY